MALAYREIIMCIIIILKLNSIYCLLKLTKSYAIDDAHTLIGQQGAFQTSAHVVQVL